MQAWNKEYRNELQNRFDGIASGLPTRMNQVTQGRTTPSLDDLPIGSARKVKAVILFFDIEGFTRREATDTDADLTRTLWTLNCVVPMMMHVIHDHGGYIEKNTGDGVMGLFVAEDGDVEAVKAALDAAVTCFYVLRTFINPHLQSVGIQPVDARIGIDSGNILVAKIGVPSGSADHQRNFLTAVGATANIACRLQQHAGTNQILVGDLVAQFVSEYRRHHLSVAAPTGWTYLRSGLPYAAWHYSEVRYEPCSLVDLVPAPPQTSSIGSLAALAGRATSPAPQRPSLAALYRLADPPSQLTLPPPPVGPRRRPFEK